jgi:drug/metabolite transporter (DMT)-like permease
VGLLFGALSALFIGSSDFVAARAGRKGAPAAAVARTSMVMAGFFAPLLFFFPSTVALRPLMFAVGSGVLASGGLLLLYRGYAKARIGIVAPTVSVLLALVPILVDFATGTRLKPWAVVGMVLGLGALVLTSASGGGKGSAKLGLVYGVSSGLLFGGSYTLLARAKEAGLLSVITQRWTAFAVLALMFPFDGGPMFTWRTPARWLGIIGGLLAGTGMACLQIGFRNASAGLVSVASSQFATVAVLLAVVFNKEHLRWWQGIGVGLTGVAVAFMALG